jgi:hypothetical protein
MAPRGRCRNGVRCGSLGFGRDGFAQLHEPVSKPHAQRLYE